MKIKKFLLLTLSLLILTSTLSACKSNTTYISDTGQDLTEDELIIKYLPYKESIYKQLENQIKDFDKLTETDITITNDIEQKWELTLCMPAKDFKLKKDKYIHINAQKNNIISNDYEDVLTQISVEEKIHNDIYTTVLGNNNFAFYNDTQTPSTYYKLIIDGIEKPTIEDYENKNNQFFLYIYLGGEETREYTSCTDDYFKQVKEAIEKLLQKDYFKDIKNITVNVNIAGCGEYKYSLTNSIPTSKILRTVDGKNKIKKLEEAKNNDKTELELLPPDEREKFIEEHQDDIDKAIQEKLEQQMNAIENNIN